MNERIYINNFCEDLNYQGVILYIGNVKYQTLFEALERDMVNKTYRLEYAASKSDMARRNFIYIENCDLCDLSFPIHEYFEEGYDVYILHEEGHGKFYVTRKL